MTWKRQAIDGLTGVFSDKLRSAEDNEAEVKCGKPKIMNTVQGNQFTGSARTTTLIEADANIFIERLRKSLKK